MSLKVHEGFLSEVKVNFAPEVPLLHSATGVTLKKPANLSVSMISRTNEFTEPAILSRRTPGVHMNTLVDAIIW